ncbi:MAG TPA: MFS transporter [Acholeplasmataceae bacterium]|jgi:melibiose permease/lactose/raffinose/galactose permease|nr:MFS transporter [Acholeplasmataceae bacterium]
MEETLKVSTKNKLFYSMPSIARDMAYTLYSMFLLVFLTNAVGVSNWELGAIGIVMAIIRVWDAVNDPIMGLIIDNTKSKWGKFKPWILLGGVTSGIFIFLLFQDYGLSGWSFVILFTILYLLLETSYTMNDIAYWSMYPSFTTNPREREKIGSLTRIFASVGMFIVVALVPLIYPTFPGGQTVGFFWIALIICLLFIVSQIVVIFGVKAQPSKIIHVKQEKTKFKNLLKIIFKNDQLVVIIVAILLFNIGYFTTTALGIYFFDYDYNKFGGSEFTFFTIILAVSQLSALALFPKLVKVFSRKKIFTCAIILVVIGYLLFFGVGYVLPMHMLIIGLAGFALFFGEGFIQVLIIVMLADTIEYGQWKLGTRNESVVFAINPFVTKLATSIQTLIVTFTLIISKMNELVINPLTELNKQNAGLDPIERIDKAREFIGNNMTDSMRLILRLSMIIIPLILILISYIIYRKKYKIDSKFYKQITDDLLKRY